MITVIQTAQSLNPQMSSLNYARTFQQQEIQRVSQKNPQVSAFKTSADLKKKQMLTQQQNENRPSYTLKQDGINKMANQIVQNKQINHVMHRNNSSPKLKKVPSVKHFSPFQKKNSTQQIACIQQASIVPQTQQSENNKDVQTPNTTRNQSDIQLSKDKPPFKRFSTNPTLENFKPEYPSCEITQGSCRESKLNNEKRQKSNSTGFASQKKSDVQEINTNQYSQDNSTGQQSQQVISQKTNASKQIIIPIVTFVNFSLPNENISRNSRTCNYILDSLGLQFKQKESENMKNSGQLDNNNIQVEGSPKPYRNFLERVPQKKIIIKQKSRDNSI